MYDDYPVALISSIICRLNPHLGCEGLPFIKIITFDLLISRCSRSVKLSSVLSGAAEDTFGTIFTGIPSTAGPSFAYDKNKAAKAG